MKPEPNEEQVHYWSESAGPRWVALQEQTDAQLRVFGLRAMDAAGLRAGERVLDVGAGCGDTTIELARRVGPSGRVHAIDVSAVMLERARERAAAEGADVATFQLADVQAGAIEGTPFDLAFSRFGIMFFDDPALAFRRIRESLAPSGRLAACTWRSREENDWLAATARAAARFVQLPNSDDIHAPGPFGLHDRDRAASMLAAGGFTSISIDPFDAPMRLGGGSTLDEAADFLIRLGPVGAAMASADQPTQARVRDAIRGVLEPHVGPDGVVMTGATWIVTARA